MQLCCALTHTRGSVHRDYSAHSTRRAHVSHLRRRFICTNTKIKLLFAFMFRLVFCLHKNKIHKYWLTARTKASRRLVSTTRAATTAAATEMTAHARINCMTEHFDVPYISSSRWLRTFSVSCIRTYTSRHIIRIRFSHKSQSADRGAALQANVPLSVCRLVNVLVNTYI